MFYTLKWVNWIKSYIFGYDIFISYSRKDGTQFASSLANTLTEKKITCFIDQWGTEPGEKLPKGLKRTLMNSRIMVIVASPKAVHSESVLQEIDLFIKKSQGLIIPIDFDCIQEASWFRKISGLARSDESLTQLHTGIPSDKTILRIVNTIGYSTRNRRLRKLAIYGISLLSLLLVGILWTGQELTETQSEISAQIELADSLKNQNNKINQKLIVQQSTLENTKKREDSASSALFQKQTDLIKADSSINDLNSTIQNLQVTENILKLRSTAQQQLPVDPVKAFLNAQKAYLLNKTDLNTRKILLEAISNIELSYNKEYVDYQLEHNRGDLLILRKGSLRKVINLRTQEEHDYTFSADYVYVFPFKDAFRLVTVDAVNDSAVFFRLLNHKNRSVITKIKGDMPWFNRRIAICSDSIVQFHAFRDQTKYFINIETGKQTKVRLNLDLETKSDGYLTLCCNEKNESAEELGNELVLSDATGHVLEKTRTNASGDDRSTKGHWSFDNTFMTYSDRNIKNLAIWQPNKQKIEYLDPDDWVAESWNWSPVTNSLALAGRSVNKLNVTLEIIPAENPSARRIIYKDDSPILGLHYSPDGSQISLINDDGELHVIDTAGRSLGSGKHINGKNVFWINEKIVTESSESVRIWNTRKTPHNYWNFIGNQKRQYYPKGSVSPEWTMMAAMFVENDTIAGIEIKSLDQPDHYVRILPVEIGHCRDLKFSNDGKWLIVSTSDLVRIWRTDNWQKFDFRLKNADSQFMGLIKDEESFLVKVDSKGQGSNEETFYRISLNSPKPEFIGREIYHHESFSEVKKSNMKLIEGWQLKRKRSEYTFAGIVNSSNGFIVNLRCRDQPLGASDCDLVFIPIDLDRLFNLYAKYLPK